MHDDVDVLVRDCSDVLVRDCSKVLGVADSAEKEGFCNRGVEVVVSKTVNE